MPQPLTGSRHHFIHQPQQPAGLRRQFIDRPAQALRRPAGSPRRCRPSVTSMYSTAWSPCTAVLTGRWYWCNRATARISVRYFRWSRRVRVLSSRKVSDSAKGLATNRGRKKPLGVVVERQGFLPLLLGQQPGKRLPLSLELMNRACLLPVFIDRQHDATVQQLFVDLDGSGCKEDHYRPLHPVFLRHQAARAGILARAGDGQRPFALQQFQGVACPLRSLFLDNRQYLVLQVRLAHVEERLAGHGRILDLILRRHKGQDGIHERRFPGGGRRLNDDGKGLIELAADGRQIADQFVGRLAHHVEVGHDPCPAGPGRAKAARLHPSLRASWPGPAPWPPSFR